MKRISDDILIKGGLLIIKEMLSDGDPFHDRILKQIQRAEDKLRMQINLNNNFLYKGED